MMLAENVVELTIASQLEFIDLVTTLTDNVTRMIGFDEESAYWVNMAVRESVANAVEHGNKYDPQKTVDIRFTIGVDALRLTVRDHGEGFDPSTLPDPLDPNNLLNPAGRGILYMRTFMDQVEYERHPEGGMIVTMAKRRAPQPVSELGEGAPNKMQLEIRERPVGDVTILEMTGKITIGEGSVQLRDAVSKLLDAGRNRIILNLGGVTYVDSSGIGELVSRFTTTKNSGGKLKLLNLTKKIKDLLMITKLLTVFEIYEDEQTALESFQ